MTYAILSTLVHAVFRVFFALEYSGVEHVPERGPVVIAGNHPSYLDPVLIGLPLSRRVFFMAWDKLFTVPVLGTVMRHYGAFPVRLGTRAPNAFQAALDVLNAGKALGIFPEAGRSKEGPMNPLKTGAARLAIATRAPIVPVTITGAYDAWPAWRRLPLPRKVTVKYHAPIVLDEAETALRAEDRAYADEVTERVRRTIERRLLPSLDADERKRRAFASPASPVRLYEFGPPIAAVVGVLLGGPPARLLLPAALLALYVLADIWWIPQNRLAKAARDFAAPAAAFALGPPLARVAGILVPEWVTLGALAFGFAAAMNWSNYHKAQRFVRGALLAFMLSFAVALALPYAYAPQVAVAAFALVYAVAWRPLFWPACALVALVYAAACAWAAGPAAAGGGAGRALAFAALGALVAGYIRVFKFAAHDGRMI